MAARRAEETTRELRLSEPLMSACEKEPLVSLEEAVKPLVKLVSDVEKNAKEAKQRCRNPASGLTPDESASIMLFTMVSGTDVALNEALRSEDKNKLKPWFQYLKLFMSGFNRLRPLQETIYRGVNSDIGNQYTIGDEIIWYGFSRCTTKLGNLSSTLNPPNKRTMFIIKCVSGRDIRQHSCYPEEQEVLLFSGTKLKVTDRLKQGDLCIIELKEIH